MVVMGRWWSWVDGDDVLMWSCVDGGHMLMMVTG